MKQYPSIPLSRFIILHSDGCGSTNPIQSRSSSNHFLPSHWSTSSLQNHLPPCFPKINSSSQPTRAYNFFFIHTPTISIPNFHNHSLYYHLNSTIKFFNHCFQFLLLPLLLRYWVLLLLHHHHSLMHAMASSLLLSLRILPLAFLLLFHPFASALLSAPETNTPYPKAFSDLKESIVKVLGLTADDLKITGLDPRDAEVGHSVQYEFDVEIDRKVIPFKLLEDVNRWDYVDLPIFRVEEPGHENGLVQKRDSANGLPVLAPFQLAGPMELWIQDAKDMRLSLPHDVDAGVLKKVILADGAVVTVKGARSVSLRQPLDLPLPLNLSQSGFAAGLLTLAEQLRHTSRTQGAPLLSLRIVGPTSLASPSSTSASRNSRLKLKRLAPGLVELSSPSNTKTVETLPTTDLEGEAPTLLTPTQFTTLWPLASLNGSNANLLGFEKLLASVLGPKANKKGSFRLLKADVSAQTFVKIGFQAEKKLKEGDGVSWEGFPEWRTKPETVNMHFEVLAKVDGDKVIAESIMPVKPVIVEDTVASNVLTGNVSMSKIPIVHPPPNYFTL